MSIQVLYRLSDKGKPKEKIPNATKERCLKNAIDVFGLGSITLFADNCEEGTLQMIRTLGIEPKLTTLGNSGSWRHIVEFAMDQYDDNQIVYLLEDDYFHLEDSVKCITEGIEIADYVTLYDHPDKYVNKDRGGNPFVKYGGELSRVVLTASTHWKHTNSTTMTFACQVKTLKKDYNTWKLFTSKKSPKDFRAFKRLIGYGNPFNKIFGKGRVLISSIPARSTHAETAYLSPLIDWRIF